MEYDHKYYHYYLYIRSCLLLRRFSEHGNVAFRILNDYLYIICICIYKYIYVYIYTYPMRYIGYIDANPTAEINSLLEGGDHGRQHDA